MGNLNAWGVEVILWFQSFSNPFLDGFFRAVTFLGDERFYLILLPFIFWCINKRWGARLTVVLFISAYVNAFLKALFALPRPFDFRIRLLDMATGYGFPSGHTQGATVTWGYLASQIRRRDWWALSGGIILLVGLSRMYLGVHYPHDVVGGLIIGVLLLLAFLWATRLWEERWAQLPLNVKLLLTVVLPLILLLVEPTNEAARPLGAMMGMGAGFVLEERLVGFACGGAWERRLARLASGLVITFALWFGLKELFPARLAFRFLRYALVGFWGAFAAPWAFVKTGLAEKAQS